LARLEVGRVALTFRALKTIIIQGEERRMKIFITGGTGFIGSHLSNLLVQNGHEVSLLVRPSEQVRDKHDKVWLIVGDPTEPGPWQEQVSAHDGVINLAGASIFSRWTRKVKENIMNSRVQTTRNLVEAMRGSSSPPRVLLSTSAVGVYGFHGDETVDENSPSGRDFLAQVCRAWEAEALGAAGAGVRVVITRFGIVVGPGGGAMGQMIPMFRRGLGGRLGSGQQWFSWVHMSDLTRALLFLLEHPEASGPFNICSPRPVTNAELAGALGHTLRKPVWLPVPGFALKILLGEFSSVLLQGQRVLPHRLIEMKFTFNFHDIEVALRDILK